MKQFLKYIYIDVILIAYVLLLATSWRPAHEKKFTKVKNFYYNKNVYIGPITHFKEYDHQMNELSFKLYNKFYKRRHGISVLEDPKACEALKEITY